jgi:starvation-inducible DNA-binding protein
LPLALRQAHDRCNAHRDLSSASLLPGWIDQTEQRIWFLSESTRNSHGAGRTTLAN